MLGCASTDHRDNVASESGHVALDPKSFGQRLRLSGGRQSSLTRSVQSNRRANGRPSPKPEKSPVDGGGPAAWRRLPKDRARPCTLFVRRIQDQRTAGFFKSTCRLSSKSWGGRRQSDRLWCASPRAAFG